MTNAELQPRRYLDPSFPNGANVDPSFQAFFRPMAQLWRFQLYRRDISKKP
jgi:hypothetical protein